VLKRFGDHPDGIPEGEHIRFVAVHFPDWTAVTRYLLPLA